VRAPDAAGFTQIIKYYLQGEVNVTPPTAKGGYVVSFDSNGFSVTKATGRSLLQLDALDLQVLGPVESSSVSSLDA